MAEKFVKFDVWCHRCKHRKESDRDDPCDECLASPANDDSERPINYENIND